MKVLIFGGRGMLGHKLVQSLASKFDVNYTLSGTFESVERFGIFNRAGTVENVDARDRGSFRDAVESSRPDVVINAVGVIKQVQGSSDVENTLTINSLFPHRLAAVCTEFGSRLITISTDCVFSGARGMYSENDIPDALDLYGQSKHWGEVSSDNCLTLRTSIIGRELNSQHGLLEWFYSQRGKPAQGYSRAIFSGFPTIVFADIIIDIVERFPKLCGVFHVSSNPISKFDLLNKINRQFGLGVQLEPASDFVIDRSLDSSNFRRLTGIVPPSWDEMVVRMGEDATPYDKWQELEN